MRPADQRLTLTALIPFLLVSVVHLAGQLASLEALTTTTKPLLIPLLAGAVIWLSRRSRSWGTWLLLAALFFSWLGDLALLVDGDTWFLLGLGCFLLAHVGYIVLFSSRFGAGRPRPWTLVYAGWFALLLVVLVPHLGGMLPPVVGYGLVICTMAVLAVRCGRVVSVGATLFLLSDSILAVNAFVDDVSIPAAGFLIMATYLAGQCLIAVGMLRRLAPVPSVEPLTVVGGLR